MFLTQPLPKRARASPVAADAVCPSHAATTAHTCEARSPPQSRRDLDLPALASEFAALPCTGTLLQYLALDAPQLEEALEDAEEVVELLGCDERVRLAREESWGGKNSVGFPQRHLQP